MANKFTGINAAKRLEKAEAEPIIEKANNAPTNGTHAPKTVGRPKGKKSGGEYQQVTVYIQKHLLLKIKELFLEREQLSIGYNEIFLKKQDFSDFVNDALFYYRSQENQKINSFLEDRRQAELKANRDEKKSAHLKAKGK
jgi:hypothetical protein